VLKWRVITASLLAPLLLGWIWLLPTGAVSTLFAVVTLIGAWEWACLMGLGGRDRLLYPLGLGLLMILGWAYCRVEEVAVPVFAAATMLWAVLLVWVFRFNRRLSVAPAPRLAEAAVGYGVLWLAWLSLTVLHQLDGGPFFITLLLFAVWGADVGAYFSGRAFGRRKLAVNVSPNKTWEGLLGGLALAVATAVLLQLVFGPGWPPLLVLLPLTVVSVLFSVGGDLFESMIKRQHGAKDSGTLLPGHGGILDRIDSLTAAGPIFVMGLLWWQLTL
jgi:phosphatidate cytidylyltransferase